LAWPEDVCASRQRDSDGSAAKPWDLNSQLSFLNSFLNPIIVTFTREIYYNGVWLGDVQLAALNCLVVEAVQ
jgi:hypothetical protein